MNGLNLFMKFNWDAFSDGKEFLVKSTSDWTDYNTKEKLGTKIEVVISKDDTSYPVKNGRTISNLYETLFFKVKKDEVKVSANKKIVPVNPTVNAYGKNKDGSFSKFLTSLSITCDDISIL